MSVIIVCPERNWKACIITVNAPPLLQGDVSRLTQLREICNHVVGVEKAILRACMQPTGEAVLSLLAERPPLAVISQWMGQQL